MSRSAKGPDDQVKLKKILDELTKREENKFCADCGCRGPRWASINLGVFICIACSGIHRSLGVHLTFVRSVNLDSWTAEQVAQMQKWGNARAKEYYEANVPRDYRVPNEHSSVREKEMWIREKYERKRFISHGEPPRRKHGGDSDDDGSDDDRSSRHSRRNERSSNSRTGSRTNSGSASSSSARTSSSSRRPEPAAKPAPPVVNDIITFDAFASPPQSAQPAPVIPAAPLAPPPAAAAPAPVQDEWASFGGSSGSQASSSAGFNDAFAPQPAAPANQHVNKMANIMASFGPPATPAQQGGFPQQQGMMPGAPMGMNPMMGQGVGMMNPQMGMMNPMQQQMGMMHNPMMGAQPQMGVMNNPMMQPGQGQFMQPQMFGAAPGAAPMGINPMMGGGMFPGGAVSMGFGAQPMGMNPMAGGMNMNPMGFQNQQQQYQQQQQQPQATGGLSQPFVNLGSSTQGGGAAKNPFF